MGKPAGRSVIAQSGQIKKTLWQGTSLSEDCDRAIPAD